MKIAFFVIVFLNFFLFHNYSSTLKILKGFSFPISNGANRRKKGSEISAVAL